MTCVVFSLTMPRIYQQKQLYMSTTWFFAIFSIFGVVTTQNVNPGEPLYLSPLIEAGQLSQAMEAALASDFFPVISYSGFITVNSTYNSNLFFWFFPAEVWMKLYVITLSYER